MRKPDLAYAKTKAQISCAVTAQLISAFVFDTRIVQFLFFLNSKFQASNNPLCLYRAVCVGPGRKPRRPVFSRHSSHNVHKLKSPYLYHEQNYPFIIIKYTKDHMSRDARKPVFGVSDQVRHKPACTVSEKS